MNAIQAHRGPDDEGLYSDKNCVLGHRRLAIIDLSVAGRQPFASEDQRYQLIYNGEIYNYIELRAELEKHGMIFRTKTDTEVLLKAYQYYGKQCLLKFNGMFAFVLYDRVDQTLFLARDRMGIKPLYYALQGSILYVASEIKAFRAIPGMSFSLNYHSLFDYLIFNRTDVYEATFFNEIRRIPKGHYGTFVRGSLKLVQWWNPDDFWRNPLGDDLAGIKQRVREILVSAVKLRMRSDVPVGSCLSGGLDSSILIGILYRQKEVQPGYPAFTASFPGHMLDETAYVDALNTRYPFKNLRTFPTAEKAHQALREFVYTNDEPTTNPSFFSQYEVMKLAKENGVTVLLDGQGGDENFAGYHYLHGFHWYGLLKSGRLARVVEELLKSIARRQDRSAYQTLLFQIFPDAMRKNLLLKSLPYLEPDFFYEYIDHSRIYNEFFQVEGLNHSLMRHFQYKLEHLLRMEDRNSMAFSLEARVPYLDHRLVEYVMRIPEALKINRGETKCIQKQCMGEFTVAQILKRTDKIGFGTPGEDWMDTARWRQTTKENYHDLCRAYPEVFRAHKPLPAKGFDRWKVNQLAVWRHLFLK